MMIRKAILITLFAFCSTAGNAAPFVTPDMIKRNGLTDEQYEMLWKQGKNPRIDIGTVRQLMFRAHRYGNVTNWLDICGKTNNFAKLSFKLQGDNFELDATNKVLVASNGVLRVECKNWKDYAEYLSVDAEQAKRIKKANKKANKLITKFKDDLEKGLKKAETDEEREFYNAWLDLINSEVNDAD